MAETLEQVLADEREDAAVLRRNRHTHEADIIERICARVSMAARDWMEFISERDAQLRSNKSVAWLRTRFPMWEREGLARHHPDKLHERQYRRVIIPRHVDVDAVRADAERQARDGEDVAA